MVGFKPAGGLRTWKDALAFSSLVFMKLGPDWMVPELYRIGASSLLNSIESRLFSLLNNGRDPAAHQLSFL
ncbi:unnamed protein product [Protopolystoma xenopodis]|uniref:Uncharacterized protein n=1 Tax=Protopolystoma xenopodis TaxID=117903 RepID=A0A448XE49_9PLAT|nr:unnamed protein product [Protopolystoma xenopodis]